MKVLSTQNSSRYAKTICCGPQFHTVGHLPPLQFADIMNLFLADSRQCGWLGSRVVSVLDSGAEGPGLAATLSGNSLRQTVHTIVPLLTKQRNW